MEDHQFEQLVSDYMPLIKSQIKKLHLTPNYAHYEQIALIALWECGDTYDASKGSFSAFAFVKIRGRLIDELRKEMNVINKTIPFDESNQVSFPSVFRSHHELSTYLIFLTDNQRKWVEHSLKELTLKEIALKEGVTVEAVKSWRKSAINKLRKVMKKNTP